MSIRNQIDARRDCVHKMDGHRAGEGSFHATHPKLYFRYKSICESSKNNRNTQILSILLCALSGGYLALVVEDSLLFAYVVIVSVCFLVNGCRTCVNVHRRIKNLLIYYNDKKLSKPRH